MKEKYIRTCKPSDREEGKPYCVYSEEDDDLLGRFETVEDAEDFLDNAERYSEKENIAMPDKNLIKAFNIKELQESSEGVFEGYASVFNNVDRVNDMVLKGAFEKTIRDNNGRIKLQYNHKDTIGIAQMAEDDRGLFIKAKVNLDVQKGREVMSLIKQGAIDKMSFAYEVLDDEKAHLDGKTIYKLKELKVYEVSAVDFPANEATEITAVKADRLRRSVDEVADPLQGVNPLSGLRKYVSNLKGEV